MSALILIASVLGLTFGVIYSLFKPHWAILLILIFYPLEQLLTTASPFFASNAKVLNILVGGLAVVGAGSALLSGRQPLRGYFNPTWVAVMALFVWGMIGIFFAPDKAPGTEDLIRGIPYLGLLLIFPALLVNVLEDFRRLIVPVLIIGSTIIVLILLSPKTTMWGGRLGIEGAGGRYGSEILNPLATAGLGGVLVILGMLYKPTSKVALIHLIRIGAISIGLIIAMLSGSRGQLIGAIFCGVVMFPFARQIKNIVQFFTVAATAGVVLVFILLVLNFATTRDAASRYSSAALSEGMDSRSAMVMHMLREWVGNPVAFVQGLGTSSFESYWTMSDAPYVHNMPAQVLSENGLIGMFILTVIMLLMARSSLRLLRTFADSPRELSTVAILVAMCMYEFLLSLKQGNWFTSAAPFWTFLILAKVDARTALDVAQGRMISAVAENYDQTEYNDEAYDGYEGYGDPAFAGGDSATP